MKKNRLKLYSLSLILSSGFSWAALPVLSENQSFEIYQQGLVKDITGRVLDEDGNPIAGVEIQNKTSKITVVSDKQGYFLLAVGIDDKIQFSKAGYFTDFKVIDDFNSLEITLVRMSNGLIDDEVLLSDVVVTGYQKLDVNKAAGSFDKIDIENFERRGSSNIIDALEGLSPGLVLSTNPSAPTSSKELTIRGISTLSGSARPLIVVDGFQYEGDLSGINPYEVKSINLLKDAAASSIYGAKAANGVIVIETKKGRKSGTQIRYTSNLTFMEKVDIGYVMNRVNSSELVEIQSQIAKQEVANGSIINYRNAFETNKPNATYRVGANNNVYQLYSDLHYGYITATEFDSKLQALKKLDNTKDLKDVYLQNPLTNQQNISVLGGNEFITYRTSLNYTDEFLNIKNYKNNRILFDFVSDVNFTQKLNFNFQSNLSLNRYSSNPLNFANTNSFTDIFNISSYDRLLDEHRNPLSVTKPAYRNIDNGIFGGKDAYEIQRLINAGLLDETYYPALDFKRYAYHNDDWSVRVQGLLNYDLTRDVTLRLGGKIQKKALKTANLAHADSWYMRHLINNFTPLSYTGDKADLIIPIGGRLQETRGEETSYLLRGQLDFDKTWGNHYANILIGSEIQTNQAESTSTDRLGYDANSNLFLPVNYYNFYNNQFEKIYMPGGNAYRNGLVFDNSFGSSENRFFSLYANAQYVYGNKYILTASTRIDQSNLFGTDPAYRYKPFWSVGAKWRAGEEAFLKENAVNLDLRVSYGFNGNIANNVGPFDIAHKAYVQRVGNLMGLSLASHSTPNLRWEQTGTFNFGLDTDFWKNRLNLSLDYYRKHSKDILSNVQIDPTLGTGNAMRNDASIINNGYEIGLRTKNVLTNKFSWETQLNFRYNKGKVKEVYFNEAHAYRYAGSIMNLKGGAPNALYVTNFAGLNSEGIAQLRQASGKLVNIDTNTDVNVFNIEDLVEAGSSLPIHVAGLNNNLRWNNFALSFLFIYQGGHKLLKDTYNGEILSRNVSLVHADVAKAWQKPGDELVTDIPARSSVVYSNLLAGSSKNVIDGDFIRLRDVVLSYTLPQNYSSSIGLQELTLNVRGSNLWLWAKNNEGIDPETQGLGVRTSPVQKSFTLGLNLIF